MDHSCPFATSPAGVGALRNRSGARPRDDLTSAAMTIDLDELIARAAIEDALRSYTRGIDRLDPDLVAAAFHPDAILSGYGSAEDMSAGDFATYAVPRLREGYTATQHRMSNTAIARDGDTALVETYVLAFHTQATDDGEVLHTFNGRYIDRFECRDGVWLIAHRTLRNDWSRVDPAVPKMNGAYIPSARDRSDPVYGGS